MEFPEAYTEDIQTAKDFLASSGCSDIYIFGSLAENKSSPDSDIDIAVRGLRKDKFFKVYGELMTRLSHPIDLVGLDYNNDFSCELLKSGTLIRI